MQAQDGVEEEKVKGGRRGQIAEIDRRVQYGSVGGGGEERREKGRRRITY